MSGEESSNPTVKLVPAAGNSLLPCNGLVSLHRIQLIGQRVAWKSPLTINGPKFRVQKASKYPRISESLSQKYCYPPKFDINQPFLSSDQLTQGISSYSELHKVPKIVGKNSCGRHPFQTSSEIQAHGHRASDELIVKNKSTSFEMQASPCLPKSRDKFISLLAYPGPAVRSSDLGGFIASDEKLPEFLTKFEMHATYLTDILRTGCLSQDPYKFWMLKSTQDKLVILNDVWGKMVGFHGIPSAGTTLVSVCLEPLLTSSPGKGISTCDKFDAVLATRIQTNELDVGMQVIQSCSNEGARPSLNRAMVCAVNVSAAQFLLFTLDAMDFFSSTMHSV
jgi:hypothetical protein